ncbi:MAG: hypothetical protein RIR41_2672, partial [Pseudomonadota bacterium]
MGFIRAGLVVLFVALLSASPDGAAQARDEPCVSLTFEGDDFTVCTARAGEDGISLSLRGADAKPHRRLSRLKSDLGE